MFSWQLSKILTTTFCNFEKKHCYKNRGSDIYRKSNYTTFYLKLYQDFFFQAVTTGYIKSYQSIKIIINGK